MLEFIILMHHPEFQFNLLVEVWYLEEPIILLIIRLGLRNVDHVLDWIKRLCSSMYCLQCGCLGVNWTTRP